VFNSRRERKAWRAGVHAGAPASAVAYAAAALDDAAAGFIRGVAARPRYYPAQ
jgi:hypothetical protein